MAADRVPLVPRPVPQAFVGIVTRKLLQGVAIGPDHKNLLAAIAAKGLCQRNRAQVALTATGTRMDSIQINFDGF